jgi:hypothetical protein
MMNQQNPLEVLKVQGQLFTKVLRVLSEVKKIEKSGFNKHQNYHYSTEQDLIGAVKQLLIDNKIIILTDSETKEVIKLYKYDKGQISGENLVTVVNTRHTFCDTETGYTYPIQSTGTGFDNTDKGSFKAITGALKYFVSKNFLVPTEDDPESDGVTKPVEAVKGFNRAKTTPVVQEAVKAVETKVAEAKLVVAAESATPAVKPGFGRRTATAAPVATNTVAVVATKPEPSFP